jgi:hypothetical protein
MHPDLRILATCCVAIMPAIASAAWQVISAEPGKRVEVDRSSIRKEEKREDRCTGAHHSRKADHRSQDLFVVPDRTGPQPLRLYLA